MLGMMKHATPIMLVLSLLIITSATQQMHVSYKLVEMHPQNLQLILRYGVSERNSLNTFNGTFTKDMVVDPPITINLTLTEEELQRIDAKLGEIGFYNTTDEELLPHGILLGENTPSVGYSLKVARNGWVRYISWCDGLSYSEGSSGQLNDFVELVMSIIEAKPEYQLLPEARGGYC